MNAKLILLSLAALLTVMPAPAQTPRRTIK